MGCCCKKKQNVDETLLSNDTENNENYSITEVPEIKQKSSKEESIKVTNTERKLGYDDFVPLKLLGTGSFGRVLLVRKKNNNKYYAMKILLKSYLKQTHQEENTRTERDLMVTINCPFVMDIKYAFQDEIHLYLVTEFMQGGDMFFHMHDKGLIKKERTKFYIIELVLAIEYLHSNNMIYRDLKPENILMDKYGHIKVTDFGLSKILDDMNDKVFTLCGTPQYMAPEVIRKRGYDKGVDWWSLGCIFYEMLTGAMPFYIPRNQKLSPRLYQTPIKFPKNMTIEEIDLISKLLAVDPKQRIGNGSNDAKDIKAQPYFKGVDWDKYYRQEIKPPFIPKLKNETDLKYFDKAFTEESINVKQQVPRSRVQSDYFGFTYNDSPMKKELDNIKNDDNALNEMKEENTEENED